MMQKLPSVLNDEWTTNRQSKLAYDYDAIVKANGTMLEGITLKVRKKTLLQEMEELQSLYVVK